MEGSNLPPSFSPPVLTGTNKNTCPLDMRVNLESGNGIGWCTLLGGVGVNFCFVSVCYSGEKSPLVEQILDLGILRGG